MKVLFVCTGNICRSPMAEALARHLEQGVVEFSSAGTHAVVGSGASPMAQRVMAELEIPLRWHRARQLTADLVAESDLVVALHPDHVAWIDGRFPGAAVSLLAAVPDPYGLDVAAYRAARDQIAQALSGRAGHWVAD